MSNKKFDLRALVEAYNGYPITTLSQRTQAISNTPRGKTILEYFNSFIAPKRNHNIAYYNRTYGTTEQRSEEEIYSAPELNKFDPYVLHYIRQAVQQGDIKREEIGQSEFFVDIVDLAEKEMQILDAKGKTPTQRQLNSIFRNAISNARYRALNEGVSEQLGYEIDRELAGHELIDYALNISMEKMKDKRYNPAELSNNKELRAQQMEKLFRAYQNGNIAGWRKIDEKYNTPDIMQYVLSSDPRFKYDGKIVVSPDDIIAVARVSMVSKQMMEQVRNGKQIEGMSRLDNGISTTQMLASADMLVAMGNIIKEESGQKNLSLSQLLPKDITDTVVRGVMANKVNGIDSFVKLAEKQRTGVLSKVTGVLFCALGLDKQKGNGDIQK